jgi:hypothetical protein
MTWLYVVIGVFLYLVIGGFVTSMCNPEYDSDDIGITLCWPLAVVAIIIAFTVVMPSKLGKIIGNFIRKKAKKE